MVNNIKSGVDIYVGLLEIIGRIVEGLGKIKEISVFIFSLQKAMTGPC